MLPLKLRYSIITKCRSIPVSIIIVMLFCSTFTLASQASYPPSTPKTSPEVIVNSFSFNEKQLDGQELEQPPPETKQSNDMIGRQLTLNTPRNNGFNYSDVLVVYNEASGLSTRVAQYFQTARNISNLNMCNITTSTAETVSRADFNIIRADIESYLEDNNLTDKINYIVTTKDVPLRVSGGFNDRACLDNELALIKGDYRANIGNSGWLINPYFEDNSPFSREKYSLYLVTRLTAFNEAEIYNFIDNATNCVGNRGTYVLDVDASKGFTGGYGVGNVWLRDANTILSNKGEQTYYDATNTFVSGQTNVMGYASWGSNDGHDTSNYVRNHGFESSTNGLPNNWYPIYDPGIADNVSVNLTDYYSGGKSLKIDRSSTSSNYTAIAQNISITPRIRYYLRGRVNVSGITGPGGAHLQIQTIDNSDNILKVQNTNIRSSTTNSWVSFQQRIYESNPNAVKVRILAVLNQSSGIAFFDTITFNDILPHHTWVPGSIAETFVSTGGRSFNYGTSYGQSLVADLIHDGVTGVKGYVYEPYLSAIAHPDILFDRYTEGYNLAESYYMASNFLSWMDVVVGDPKMAAYADVLPDLSISADRLTFYPQAPNQHEEITLTANITNIGLRNVSNVNVKTYLVTTDPEQKIMIDEQNIDSISGSGDFYILEVKYVATTPGQVSFQIEVDPNNIIRETSLANNYAQKDIYINHPPGSLTLSCLNTTIYRGEQIVLIANGSDIESTKDLLLPAIEFRLEPDGAWTDFSESQVSYEFNAIADNWRIIIVSNKSMELGEYSFRVAFTDLNDFTSTYYTLHYALAIWNNLPFINSITVDKHEVYREQRLNISCKVTDFEDTAAELIVLIHYRKKPDGTSSYGWLAIPEIMFHDQTQQWFTYLQFDKSSELGEYQVRCQVIDLDINFSAWQQFESDIMLLNNLPYILDFNIYKHRLYRTSSVELLINGDDVEDYNAQDQFRVEIEASDDPTFDNIILSLLDPELKFYKFDGAWRYVFTPETYSKLGEYYFRARIKDIDGNLSQWAMANQSVLVLNHKPVANQGKTPDLALEDEIVTFDAKSSTDIEDEHTFLSFYWEISSIPSVESNNMTFTHSFSKAGAYQVHLMVTDSDGSFTWDNRTLIIENEKPQAVIEVNQTSASVNQLILFDATNSTDSSSDHGALKYSWDFGDGITSEEKTVEHSYPESKKYIVTLTVTDDDGAMHSITKQIIIKPATENGPDTPTKPDGDSGSQNDEFTSVVYFSGLALIIGVIILVLIMLGITMRRRKQADIKPSLPAGVKPYPPEPQTVEIPHTQELLRAPSSGGPAIVPGPTLSPSVKITTLDLSAPQPSVIPVIGKVPQQESATLGSVASVPQLPPTSTTAPDLDQAPEPALEPELGAEPVPESNEELNEQPDQEALPLTASEDPVDPILTETVISEHDDPVLNISLPGSAIEPETTGVTQEPTPTTSIDETKTTTISKSTSPAPAAKEDPEIHDLLSSIIKKTDDADESEEEQGNDK